MSTTFSLQRLRDSLDGSAKMPVVFLGHGTPMNAIEDNPFSRCRAELGRTLPRPQAIVAISAHWMTQGHTLVDISSQPRTIHDFGGFPDLLYAQQYPAKGQPQLAEEVATMLCSHHVKTDSGWGLDHGTWSLLLSMYPKADIPVFQLSIDMAQPLDSHLEIGKMLAQLRHKGVLLLGSGNIVHNLRAMRFDGTAHDWAIEFDAHVAERLQERNFAALANEKSMGSLLRMANPTLEHYIPALTIAGASDDNDELFFTTEAIDLGSVSMRSFVFHG